jgi:hypothetical protein
MIIIMMMIMMIMMVVIIMIMMTVITMIMMILPLEELLITRNIADVEDGIPHHDIVVQGLDHHI